MSLQLSGLVGGLVATAAMTVLMMTVGEDSPPPTAMLWATYVGDGDPAEYLPQGMALHFLYGTGAGWVYALVGAAGLAALGPLTALGSGLANGAVYGLLLVPGVVFWGKVIEMDAGPKQLATMAAFHLVYGLVLGGFVGLGILV